LGEIPNDIDAAYYLIHSMSSSADNYDKFEKASALNFVSQINQTKAQHVIYLSGIVNDDTLSKHLSSRKRRDIEYWNVCNDYFKSGNNSRIWKCFL
jgi:hypothetical protein